MNEPQLKNKMAEFLPFYIVFGYIVITIFVIVFAYVAVRCLFSRPTSSSPIRGINTIPGLYDLDVPVEESVRRHSIFQILVDKPSDDS